MTTNSNSRALKPAISRRAIYAACSLIAITACQTMPPTPYQPSEAGLGYSELALGEGIYRVSFKGNSATPYQSVEDFLLYRAAELASEHGAEVFAVLRNDNPSILVESTPEGSVCHYSPADFSSFVYYPDLLGAEDAAPVATSFEAFIDVKMGPPPSGAIDAQVFRTAETLEVLAPCIEAP